MRRFITILFVASLLVTLLLGFAASDVMAQSRPAAPRKIVVFKKNFINEPAQGALLRNAGAAKIKPLSLINGMAVYLPPQAKRVLKERPEVLRIDDDLIITAVAEPEAKPTKPDKPGKPKPEPPPQPTEQLPWGIDRINAELAWNTTVGATIKVAILDTGIDLNHLDLKDNIKGNVNLINPRKSGNDNNGHGTHVAGIVAAVDNEIGVIGAGPEISLYTVKVLDRRGSGWLSDLIEGLQWCINNKMQVVNMSLGSSGHNQSFYDAILQAYQAGIILVASAGNNGQYDGAILYPAKYPETIAVSAIDEYDQFAYFSSYGPEIDLTAPGVNIYSAYNDGNYEILNGTSMAAPHVTGTAALVLSVKGQLGPEQMKTHLMNTSEDLQLHIHLQGAGLVRADLATQ